MFCELETYRDTREGENEVVIRQRHPSVNEGGWARRLKDSILVNSHRHTMRHAFLTSFYSEETKGRGTK